MRLNRLLLRNLVHYWRTNLPIIAGIAIAIAVLSGALLTGQSVRQSLRRLLLDRIGAAEYLVTANGFFSENLAGALATRGSSCPIIFLKGVLTLEQTGVRAYEVNVYGVDERFWKFQGLADQAVPEDREGLVGAVLARYLDAKPGDALLLSIESKQAVPRELLYGRRDVVGKTMRLRCGGILPTSRMGEFSLQPGQGNVYSIFVPLKRLQKELEQPLQANAILLGTQLNDSAPEAISNLIKKAWSLPDAGLKLKDSPARNAFFLESNRVIIGDALAEAALKAASGLGMQASPVYTYLANTIRAKGREIPYSVIAAVDLGKGAMTSIQTGAGTSTQSVGSNDSIWITDWARQDLDVSEGEPVEVDYYVWQDDGRLVTRTALFRMAGVIPISGDVDASLAPEIPGITQADSISSWDPPFPLELNRIRPEDEEYWNRHKGTPKAFISLAKGQELWGNRFGKLTGVRIALSGNADLESGKEKFAKALLGNLDSQQAGFAINAVREQGLAASRGATDFGEYFAYFSSFLIAAALLLSGLFFRLMIEHRVREIGLLRAIGFPVSTLRRMLVWEGLILSLAGSILGLLGALAYGWFMIFGLRTWWIGAVGTQHLSFHISWLDLALGAAAGILFSLGSTVWTLRGLQRNSPRALLTGVLESVALRSSRARTFGFISLIALSAALLLVAGSLLQKVPQIEGFFGAGFLMLFAILCATAVYLRGSHADLIRGNGWPAFFRFGLRNAMHRPGRSLLCASLIASATFMIVSMEAFRQDPQSISLEAKSGTGGYPLIAESALPVVFDPNSAEGIEALGLSNLESPYKEQVRFISFRERPGDDASCLNLYAPREPKILGAPPDFLSAGRFSFQSALAETPEQKRNPWLLLDGSTDGKAIPAIADANTIQYILHLSVGSELTVTGSGGVPIRLRLVAALRDSILQGELLISEANFLHYFPEHEGYRFFLLDIPQNATEALKAPLKQAMAHWGMQVESSKDRLWAYKQVENAYLSTFQSLGALGLILGTLGLSAILLRNVFERRQELALLRAVGYRRGVLAGIVLSENVVLLSWGLVSGTICALIAIIPALHIRGASFPFMASALLLMSVWVAGTATSILAVIIAFRSPLLNALRGE